MTSTVRWFPHGATWHLEGRLRWSDLQDRLSSRDRRIPSGFLAGRPDGQCWTWDGVSLLIMDLWSGLPENVFDVDYRRHGSAVNEPGRNLVVRANSRSDPASV